ncbi:hypothetical protein RIF29_09514 [Crotalaria pallida]|uniref:Uncharacterized protein n=1 Tax=Crotalaria pallida TaxID=3830 RepID=A0AAN9FUI2_CROPI
MSHVLPPSRVSVTRYSSMKMKGGGVAEILKDRLSWFRDCPTVDVLNMMSTANGGTIELLYMQNVPPTILLRFLQEHRSEWADSSIDAYSSAAIRFFGVDEHAVGTSAELIFAPIDASFSDDAPILPSDFHIIPLEAQTLARWICNSYRYVENTLEKIFDDNGKKTLCSEFPQIMQQV